MAGRTGAGLTPDHLDFSEAGSGDWPGIWQVFQQVVATGDTYPFAPNTTEADARSVWMRHGDREATYVGRMGADVVATAYIKVNQPGLGDHVANAGWMVSPSRQGMGIGRRFGEYVFDQARHLGFRGMQFNSVVATNTGAIALWESLGFEIVGTVPDAFRHSIEGLVPVHVMYREL